jgi:hypothetical protein
MERDTLFIEGRAPAGVWDGMQQLCNLRSREMLDGFRRLALEWGIWEVKWPEYWYVHAFPLRYHALSSLHLGRYADSRPNSWDSFAHLPSIRTCLFICRAPQVPNADLRNIDVLDPNVAWKIMQVSEEIQNECLEAIRKTGAKVAVSGTSASWTTDSVGRRSLELGMARIGDRKTEVKNISKEQQESERRAMDWFG